MGHTPDAPALNALLERVRNADLDDADLAREVWAAVLGPDRAAVPDIFGDLHQARAFARRATPNFWMTSGLCELSGHATIGPDYNGAHRAALEAEWGNNRITDGGFSEDLHPGSDPGSECLAIVSCVLQALLYKAHHPGGAGVADQDRFPERAR